MSELWALGSEARRYKQGMFFSRLKGKEVISKDGEKMGKVVDVVFSPIYFLGIVVKYRGKRYVVDKSYVYSYGDKIVLKERMLFSYLGKKVFSAEGEYLGKVKEVLKDKNGQFKGLVVSKKGRKREIDRMSIKIIKTNIVLR